MKGRREGSRAVQGPTEDDSGLIDLAALSGLDAHGDPVSGLKRRAAIGPLDTSIPVLKPHRSIRWLPIAVVGTGGLLSLAVVFIAIVLRDAGPAQPAVAEANAAAMPPPLPSQPTPEEPPALAAAAPVVPVAEATAQPAAAIQDGEPRTTEVAADERERELQEVDDSESSNVHERRAERRERRKARARENLPERPSRAAILAGMSRVQTRMHKCAAGAGGVAQLELVIDGPRGRVHSARASGVSGTVARCVTQIAKRARFKPFADPRFQVKYPVRL